MKSFTFLILTLMLFISCISDDSNTATYESELSELNLLKDQIEALASTSACNESSDCEFIAFGSKPCGGPWSYLVYSTSIDTDQLENLIEDYNQKETVFNLKWDVVSDCSLAIPPTSINCENNICIPVY